jgi:CRISPR-associated exonuclease Cas4
MYAEEDLLPLSGVQHLAFCERQWGLIQIEQQWEDNLFTAEGKLLHEKADSGLSGTRAGMRIARSLALRSFRLGLTGKADVVEFPLEGGPPVPVEYKRGKPKGGDCDRVQVCAQALCLEEQLGVVVPRGALYYGQTARRVEVEFDAPLRARVGQLCERMHALHRAGATPAAEYGPKCKPCSLLHVCEPRSMGARQSARAYFERRLAAALRQEGEDPG